MASYQIKKESAQAKFFSEYLVFRQKYYSGEDNPKFWEEVTTAAKELTDKYVNEDFIKYARQLVMCHLEDVERRFKDE